MSYEVKTPVFEGPLDLLLQLITSHHLEVTELSLSNLVSAYLAHLDLMRSFDIEVTSEFLVIAATLVQLKARSLLPGPGGVDIDEDLLLSEERDRLLSRLLANLTFKDVAAVLAHRLESTAQMISREAGLDPGVEPPPTEVIVGVDIDGLHDLADRVFSRVSEQPDLDHLDLDLPSVSDAIADIRSRLDVAAELDFDTVTAHLSRPIEVIAYFLAVLELARWGLVRPTQSDTAAPIALHRTEASVNAIVSEWDES